MKRAVVFIVMLFATGALQARDLFRILPESTGRIRSEAVQSQSVRVAIDKDALAEGDVTIPVLQELRIYQVSNNVVTWTHHDVTTYKNVRDYTAVFDLGDPDKPSVIIRSNNIMSGVVVTPKNVAYELDPDPVSDDYFLTRVDWSKFHCYAMEPKTAESVVLPSRRRAVSPYQNSVINLSERYTQHAMDGVGGKDKMEAMIQAMVVMLNQTVLRSHVYNVTFKLVRMGLIPFDEWDPKYTSYQAYLDWITASPDAASDRSQTGAQLVGLWIGSGGGIAWAPRSYAQFTPQNGFHVIGNTIGLAIAGGEHEVLHNEGLQHDVLDVASASGDNFLFARDKCSSGFVEVMASTKCLAQGVAPNWIPYFSSSDPTLTYNGEPLGSDMMDNARMLRIGAPLVAAYAGQISKTSP